MSELYERAVKLGPQKDDRYEIEEYKEEGRLPSYSLRNSRVDELIGVSLGRYDVPNWRSSIIIDTILSHFESKQKDENGLLPCAHCGGPGDIRKYENGRFYLLCQTHGTGICLNPTFDTFSAASMTLYFDKEQARSDWNTRNGVQL